MIHPGVALALAMAAAGLPSRATGQDPDPNCSGTLAGKHFTTIYELPTGYHLEGLWTLRFNERPTSAPMGAVGIHVVLTTLFESDSLPAMQREIPLAVPWQVETVGRDAGDAVKQVIDLWCTAVLRARSHGMRFGRAPVANRGRIT